MAGTAPGIADLLRNHAFTVRVPVKDDVPRLIRLVNGLAAEAELLFVVPIDAENGGASVDAYLETVAKSDNQAIFVAEPRAKAGRPAEFAGLATASGGVHSAKRGVVEIGIGVRAGHQRTGIGQALMRAVESWARGAAIHRLQLPVVTTNAPAIALYRAAGFAVEGVLRQSVVVAGQPVDQYMMAKLLV